MKSWNWNHIFCMVGTFWLWSCCSIVRWPKTIIIWPVLKTWRWILKIRNNCQITLYQSLYFWVKTTLTWKNILGEGIYKLTVQEYCWHNYDIIRLGERVCFDMLIRRIFYERDKYKGDNNKNLLMKPHR